MSRRFRSVVDWGLGFGCRFGPMRLLLGLLGFWSRQLLSGSGNPRCAVDSAPSAQLLSRLNRSHQLSAATTAVRQQQVSAGYSSSPQLNQPPAQLFAAAAATHLRRSHLLGAGLTADTPPRLPFLPCASASTQGFPSQPLRLPTDLALSLPPHLCSSNGLFFGSRVAILPEQWICSSHGFSRVQDYG